VLALAVLALALPFGAARASPTIQEGLVSWYGGQFHARPTASGELFDAFAMTMAHPTLPFGTKVRVTNLRNGRSVVLRVNDRGPFVGSRIADLSQAAAEYLGMLRRGVAQARIEVLHELGRGD
jgi:rare lipoprotein A